MLSVIIPVYNEVASLEQILRRVLADPHEKEVVLVDDGSTDGTRELLASLESPPQVRVVLHERNRGKGAAVRTGIQHAVGDLILIQDADLEYDPADYPALLEPLLDGHADVVFGSRFLGGPHRVLFFWHYVGNRFLTVLSNAMTNLNLSDMETGYKAFRREALEGITLRSDRFGFEPEFTAKMAKRGCRIYEVPIRYHGRTYREGKKITWRDGIAAIYTIVRFRLWD